MQRRQLSGSRQRGAVPGVDGGLPELPRKIHEIAKFGMQGQVCRAGVGLGQGAFAQITGAVAVGARRRTLFMR